MNIPEQYVKKILSSHVYDVAIETPLQDAAGLSARLGHEVALKREDLQPVFSFKLRGSYNKMVQLSATDAGHRRGSGGLRLPRGGRCGRAAGCAWRSTRSTSSPTASP